MEPKISSVFYLGSEKNNFLKLSHPKKARVYYYNYSYDLLSQNKGARTIYDFLEDIENFPLGTQVKGRVYHLAYELGHLLNETGVRPSPSVPLAVELEYEDWDEGGLLGPTPDFQLEQVNSPTYKTYEKAFQRCLHHLLEGDCYQLNLTYPFHFKLSQALGAEEAHLCLNSFGKLLGAYAHATFLGPMDTAFISNSPECLFQMAEARNSMKVWSLPIKGTASLEGSNEESAWQKLQSSRKEAAELDMIIDLIRNDLSRIDKPTARVVSRRLPLRVPGLLHQMGSVAVEVSKNTGLGQLLSSLFPGGSITGAPKKRVMQLLAEIEEGERGHYCGSTLLFHGDIKAASINIRTATLRPKEGLLSYHAGGGVTLRSQAGSEYEEMLNKVDSFTRAFGGHRPLDNKKY